MDKKKSAGVAILRDNFKGKILEKSFDEKGHWIFLMVELHSHKFLIGNVYGYNSETLNNLLITELEDNIDLLLRKY